MDRFRRSLSLRWADLHIASAVASRLLLIGLSLCVALWLIGLSPSWAAAQETGDIDLVITGRLVNAHEDPVADAAVKVRIDGREWPVRVEGLEQEAAHSALDGSFRLALAVPRSVLSDIATGRSNLFVIASKPAYRTAVIPVTHPGFAGPELLADLGPVMMVRLVNASFVIAAFVFLLVFILISFHVLHETIAALLGVGLIFSVTYFVGSFNRDFWILSFERSLAYIDFNVIFLILGMMIFMAVLAETGVFPWLAYRAFQMTKGNAWFLAVILTILTGVISSLLNDVTAILLVAPVSIEIALISDTHPFAFIIPEVLASNIGGASTLIGDPPSTIVGSYLGLSFTEYVVNMGPLGGMMLLVLVLMIWLLYRKTYARARARFSPTLLARLESSARITDPILLRKSLIVAGATLVLFFIEDLFAMPPSVVALTGATVLLVWVRPDVHRMLSEVDWTTLVFFIALFILVGGLEETGVIQVVADLIGHLAGGNLTLAVILMVWVSGIASALVANIPFTLAVLPVASFLTRTISGAENQVLFWALVVGADFGGNATYLGSAPNIVAAGLLDRAGYHLSFLRFMRDGVPVTIVTLLLSTIWLLLRY
ncbi:MAG TPA: ArsB/NhaD family transporter [Caldilineae bacterium]|nr:ArsB/NhaD family transporter [Caldilineae bacterium]